MDCDILRSLGYRKRITVLGFDTKINHARLVSRLDFLVMHGWVEAVFAPNGFASYVLTRLGRERLEFASRFYDPYNDIPVFSVSEAEK
jgi:DNA-binding PadR family transcriptional regulator